MIGLEVKFANCRGASARRASWGSGGIGLFGESNYLKAETMVGKEVKQDGGSSIEEGRSPSAQPSFSRLLATMVFVLTSYYMLSSLTLPFADDLWLGELPVLAIVQLPKSYAHDAVQHRLMMLMRYVGLSRGSPSPDMIASNPWAFGVVFVAPSAILIGIIGSCRGLKQYRSWIICLLVAALIDAAVTIWFEKTASLSIF
jgi:hypothetical protein